MNLKTVLRDLFHDSDMNVAITDAYGNPIVTMRKVSDVFEMLDNSSDETQNDVFSTKVIKVVPHFITIWKISFYEISLNVVKTNKEREDF